MHGHANAPLKFRSRAETKMSSTVTATMAKTTRGLNAVSIIPTDFIETMGPKTRKATSAGVGNMFEYERAKNASTVEQIDSTNARLIMATIANTTPAPMLVIEERGIRTCVAAATDAPM